MPRPRLRVLLVGRGAPERGGIAATVDLLLGSGLGEEHELTFLNLTPTERGGGGRLDRRNLVRTAADARAVRRAARGHDVVHVHSALAPATTLLRAGVLCAAARGGGRGVVLHAHGGRIPAWLTNRRRRLAARLATRPASAIVAVSTAGREALARATGRVVHLVDNGVPIPPAAPSRPTPARPVILFVGVLTERKGAIDLLRASEQLRLDGIDHEVWLVGGTPDEGASAAAEVEAAAGPDARFLGAVPHDEVLDLLARADVFCLPSWWEAMPLSILEAMAAGLPVVATAVGDVARAVIDGQTGLLVPAKDPERLAAAIASLLGDPARCRSMGTAARAHVTAHFSLDRTIEAVRSVYAQVVRSG